MIVSIDYAARVLYNRLSIVLIGSDPPRHGVSSLPHAEKDVINGVVWLFESRLGSIRAPLSSILTNEIAAFMVLYWQWTQHFASKGSHTRILADTC